jgi:FkbM family methyltransferase
MKAASPEDPVGSNERVLRHAMLDRKLVVMDIGCRWGFGNRFADHQHLFQVYGFDPDAEECVSLSQRYDPDFATVVPVALAGSRGKRTLFITKEPACSSLLIPDPVLTENYPALSCAKHVSSIQVDTVTLDDWASLNRVTAIDFMKIDTQGTELEILQGSALALNQARCIEVEVEFNPIYVGQPLFSDIDSLLRKHGFILWKLTNQVHYSRSGNPDASIGEDSVFYDDLQQIKRPLFGGQLYWANAHYIKKDLLELIPISESQRQRDIVLFDSLGMPDVVNHFRLTTDFETFK